MNGAPPTERNVAAATQNQALSALLFLYSQVLELDLPWLDGMIRAKRPVRLPVVLSESEVRALLAELEGARWLMASLLYGAGLRLQIFDRLQKNSSRAPLSNSVECAL